jgi:UDP-N-acetylglucosamine--N-acetylmuramyl-(pentapeptide) pyrophosphoryl-undecaprenol N-acetylglucosamine transferase
VKRLIICVGGTAGHLFPAQALARQLLENDSPPELLFIGHGLATNPFFDREAFSFEEVEAGPIRRAMEIVKGYRRSLRLLKSYSPDLIVGFGSYHSFPPLLAARRLSLPMVLHEANAYPGRVNRLFSSYAKVTGVHFASASGRLKGRSELVGLPLRVNRAEGDRSEALRALQLEEGRTTLLVFGGSQGARRINQLVEEVDWPSDRVQVIHLTGDGEATQRLRRRYEKLGLPAYVQTFERQMERVWCCADLAISRAGAASIAEQRRWRVPALLIPYPYAADRHQDYNAQEVAGLGGALVLPEKGLSSNDLGNRVREIIGGSQLQEMRQKLCQSRESNPDRFADLVSNVLKSKD